MTEPAVLTSPILLLVEDDAGIQPILEDALTEAGFEVVTADNGTAAIAELNADGARFKAVITDIRLGKGPSGWEVGHRAREIVSGIPVIYVSGDSAHEWSANGVPESIMLQKPFAIAQLITAVTTLLNNASNAMAQTMTNDARTKLSSD
jgi:DNA-binding response OmpR family regulator